MARRPTPPAVSDNKPDSMPHHPRYALLFCLPVWPSLGALNVSCSVHTYQGCLVRRRMVDATVPRKEHPHQARGQQQPQPTGSNPAQRPVCTCRIKNRTGSSCIQRFVVCMRHPRVGCFYRKLVKHKLQDNARRKTEMNIHALRRLSRHPQISTPVASWPIFSDAKHSPRNDANSSARRRDHHKGKWKNVN